MKDTQRSREVLAHLKSLIAQGAEFPEAVYSTSRSYELASKEVEVLEQLYDQGFI